MLVKVMSDQHELPDDDPSKQCTIFDDVKKFSFSRMDDRPFIRIEFSDGQTSHIRVVGNVYVMNEIGDVTALYQPNELQTVAPKPLIGWGPKNENTEALAAKEADDRTTFDMWMLEAGEALGKTLEQVQALKDDIENRLSKVEKDLYDHISKRHSKYKNGGFETAIDSKPWKI